MDLRSPEQVSARDHVSEQYASTFVGQKYPRCHYQTGQDGETWFSTVLPPQDQSVHQKEKVIHSLQIAHSRRFG